MDGYELSNPSINDFKLKNLAFSISYCYKHIKPFLNLQNRAISFKIDRHLDTCQNKRTPNFYTCK